MQVKLLRVLQEGEVDPIGSKRTVPVDVRIISATNRNLHDQVRSGQFREDLYYRLNVFPIEVPSLRERREDIGALTEHFIRRFNAQERMKVNGPSKDALEILRSYEWPGNVRQLENAIFRAMILSDGQTLHPQDFPQISGQMPTLDLRDNLSALAAAASVDKGGVSVVDPEGHLRRLEDIERDLIQFAIETYSGHMSEVARRLGIGRSTLYRKVREHGVEVDTAKSA
jgi:DNA-binding NtrC family response regulator